MIQLTSERWAATLDLRRGCTMTSLIDRIHDRELLWSKPGGPPTPLGPTGEASRAFFDRHVFIGGWFAMFPFAGGPGTRADIRLHGEAPRIAWNLSTKTSSALRAAAEIPGTALRVERAIELGSSAVRVMTSAVNEGAAIDVAFGEHPCFDIRGLGVSAVRAGSTIDIADDDRVEHLVRPALGYATIVTSDGEDLELEWDAARLPGLLIWRDGTKTIAVEPKSFTGRSADDVRDAWVTIETGERIEWSLQLQRAPQHTSAGER